MRKLNGFLFSSTRFTSFRVRFKDTARRIRCFPAIFEPRQTSAAFCVKSKMVITGVVVGTSVVGVHPDATILELPADAFARDHAPAVFAKDQAVGEGGFDSPHVGVNVYPDVTAAMPTMHRDPMNPPVLFDPTGQHPDGPNLYQYVRSNPVRWQDPNGTNIYLKTGNNSGNPINDAIHQNVCVDTCENGQKGVACFSFGKTGWMFRFGARLTWLGWNSYTLGGFVMKGQIYPAEDTGTVVNTKVTTPAQDKAWLNWMRRYRLGTEDVYSVGRHNCRTYSQWEFNDAP